jgi:hypothetical protein
MAHAVLCSPDRCPRVSEGRGLLHESLQMPGTADTQTQVSVPVALSPSPFGHVELGGLDATQLPSAVHESSSPGIHYAHVDRGERIQGGCDFFTRGRHTRPRPQARCLITDEAPEVGAAGVRHVPILAIHQASRTASELTTPSPISLDPG